jgi:outer membrane protein assembly factor BamB
MKTTRETKILVALTLMVTIVIPLIALPIANAHSPPWEITTWAYVTAAPNPVGVGQKVIIVGWSSIVLPSATATNDIRFKDLQLQITRPDNTTQTIPLPNSDSTSTAYISYTPDQVGTYAIVFSYPDLKFTWDSTSSLRTWTNDTFKGATSKTFYITVQQEPVPEPITSYPMPSEYWTRPIEGQNTYWYTIASNWLGAADFSSAGSPQIIGDVQPDGSAPNSAHIMWTKPMNDGGVVGGSNTAIDGNTFYTGSSYNLRFSKPIIMNGRLYYDIPVGNAATGGGLQCIDLRTGEEIWWLNRTAYSPTVPLAAFGYYYAFESMNQHGIVPDGMIFTSNFGRAIDPRTGQVYTLNITNVPNGFAALGPAGEHIRYIIANIGTSENPDWHIQQWNSSNVFTTQTSGTINASTTNRFDWDVKAPAGITSTSTVYSAIVDDILIGSTITSSLFSSFSARGTINPYTVWAVSLNPNSRGTLLWMKDYSAPEGNVTRTLTAVDKVNRVFIMTDKETLQWLGYSMEDGRLLWTTERQTASDNEFWSTGGTVAYGNFYYSGYGGILYCFDTKTGKLEFTYGNGGEGNSTDSGLYTPWGNYPYTIHAIADGKVYLMSGEHSQNTPLYKNSLVLCVNATTGQEIWAIFGNAGYRTRSGAAVADGFLVYHNLYDQQIYCFGKGPSTTTISASPKVIQFGASIILEGTIIDLAAGTKQKEQAARFPNGVPAVSDASQQKWMEYVYMQKPRPTDTVGVPIRISVVDSNGNYRDVGEVTSDSDGYYSLNWKPDIEGKYTVYASFDGSESYWPSHAVTSFAVDQAETTPTPTSEQEQSIADMYFIPAVAGLFVFVAIIGIVIILMLRKRP